MTDKELMQQALIKAARFAHVDEAAAMLRAALAQPVVAPEWVGLTDDEIKGIIGAWGGATIKGYTRKLFDQIEAKLKEKNA